MAGKFTNTKVVNTVSSLTESYKSKLNNTYNGNLGKSRFIIDYYPINREASHIDESTGLVEDNIGFDSPIRYDLIKNIVVFTDDGTLSTSISETEFGPECDPYTGRFNIMPNTVEPTIGDHFQIPHINDDYLFKVIDIQTARLDSDQMFYEIEWELIEVKSNRIKPLIINTYEFIMNNVGTDLNPIILSDNYTLAKDLDDLLIQLRDYYKELFFDQGTQSLIYQNELGMPIYDSFLTQFCSETKVLSDIDNYMYLQHQLPKPTQFNFLYSMSVFNCIKTKDMKRLKSKKLINVGLLLAIDRMYTIFYTKPQTYFNVEYTIEDLTMHTHLAEYMIHPFEDILIENIISNTLMEDDILSNIIIKYFNNTPLNEDDIENIRYIYMKKSSKLFYYIPCVLFIIEQTIKTIMSKKEM